MKMPASLLLLLPILLVTGCTGIPSYTPGGDEDQPSATRMERVRPQDRQSTRERRVQFGNWRVDCIYEEVNFSTQCKAETYGKISVSVGDEIYHPTPVLWIAWLKGEPRGYRSVCVFGHDYPVKAVSMRVDGNPPLQIGAHNATGCVPADSNILKQLRAGRELAVTFHRWPWGETTATFNLHRSSRALEELDRLVAAQ
ncbi:MAG: hypothetical protein R3F42_01240 [Pseudomonadota bacterium]